MGLFESITHKEEIQNLLDEAQRKFDASLNKFESQKKETTLSLEKLGRIKINVWANRMDNFAHTFNSFKNIEIIQKIETNQYFIGSDEDPQQMLMNINQATMTANEVAKAGLASVGTGALVGIASYGGAMMFASASSGTAIAALSGAAKTNATLAWFGGGSIKSGGLGMAGGKIMLAGIVLVPILGVAALITSAKSKEKLAEAKKVNAEAKEAASKMDVVTTGMAGIAKMSNNYSSFITKMDKKFAPFIKELERIKNEHLHDNGDKIDFNLLTTVEQKTLHISWLMAQLYYHVLSTPILTEQGQISNEAIGALSASTSDLKQLRKDTFRMKGEEAPIGNLFWGTTAKKIMIVNFAAMLILILSGIALLGSNIILGIACFLGAVIAFPISFKFRNLPASKLCLWRMIRLVAAIVIVITSAVLVR